MQGLREAGYVDGQNMVLEARFHGGPGGVLDQYAREFIALKCSVIFASNPYAIRAVLKATSTIPTVGIDLESDPVASGLAKSLARPGAAGTASFSNSICLPPSSGISRKKPVKLPHRRFGFEGQVADHQSVQFVP